MQCTLKKSLHVQICSGVTRWGAMHVVVVVLWPRTLQRDLLGLEPGSRHELKSPVSKAGIGNTEAR